MASSERPSTPPGRRPAATAQSPITPEQVRRREEARLRSKALSRLNQESSTSNASADRATKGNYLTLAGQKRPHAATVSRDEPATRRDARQIPSSATAGSSSSTTTNTAATTTAANIPHSNNGLAAAADTGIRAARKFQKYVEYDLSKMQDTKGGFMSAADDPHNRALYSSGGGGANTDPNNPSNKPANLSLAEWEQQQLHRRLRETRSGPYEPGLSVLDGQDAKVCRECGSREIDWQWEETLHCRVCHACKDKFPEKYSLLTKTEAREDYLLTDPELKDESLLPRLERPNPHKASWNNMMLYLRYQVEEYAFSARKWGGAAELDAEFERRTREAKDRKEKKFRKKLDELKRRTRVDAYKRARGGGGGEFGDTIGKGRHEHEWGRAVEDGETGMMKKACVECGMEVEELEF